MTRHKPDTCSGCPIAAHGTDFSQPEGAGANGVMLVGEASGEHEMRDQLPFRPYAPAGGVLTRVLNRMGLAREQFAITNVCRCRPRNNWLENAPYEYAALRHCRPNLDAAIAKYRPRAIVALGGIATRELTGEAGEARGVGHLAGYCLPLASSKAPCDNCISYDSLDVPRNQRMTDASCDQCHGTGYVVSKNAIPVLANFHPSYLRRGKASHQGVFARILQRALAVARGIDREYMWGVDPDDAGTHGTLQYITHPTTDVVRDYLDLLAHHPDWTISYDLETSESASLDEDAREGFVNTEIRLAQFSHREGFGIALGPEHWEAARRLLALPNVKCGHNIWLFDDKVLRVHDTVPSGVRHDTLQMFHHWQPDLPAHLQFAASFVRFPFPWKHMAGSHIEFYGCADVDATLRLYNFLRAQLERDGIWGDDTRGYLGQVYEVRPVLAGMEDRGVPIDDAARLRLDGEFAAAQAELCEAISRLAEGLGRVHPKEGYKTIPPEVRQWQKVQASVTVDNELPPHKYTEAGDDGKSYGYAIREFAVAGVDATGNPVVDKVRRICRVYDFNPNSSQQLLAYMRHKGHPVPKDKHREDDEGNNPDTTGKKELVRLAKKVGDTFYLKVIEYRELSKARGTYIEGFKPGADGRVHTTFTFDTGIGQLSSRNPNVQNFPKHGKLANAMRAMVAAPDGHVLTEWDFKSCHVLTLGFLAEDEQYIRCARIDMHSIMTGHFLKLWDTPTILRTESDAQIKARCKWLKSQPEYKQVRDAKVKHAGLGIGNGLREKGLFERYMEFFASQKEAGSILKAYEGVFARVFAWQKRIQRLAHEQQMLKTQFGHIRRFYEVFRWDGRRGVWSHGDQAEEAIAYWLANIAFGHIREKLKALHRAGLDAKYGLFNNIHDSFLFCFPQHMMQEHVREVYPILSAPSEVLRHPTIAPDGLVIDVDGAWGQRWNEMREINVREWINGCDSGSVDSSSDRGAVGVGEAAVTA